MRAPLSWLRDFAPFPDDVGELRAALDDLGLVVEAIEHVGEGLGDVVVAEVLAIDPIKGADKIQLVTVGAGTAAPLEIVCGAHNFAVGDRVPLAPVGAILPEGFEITQRKLRGVVSNGMLCSGKELKLSDDGDGLLILGDEAPGAPGTPLTEALGLEPDIVFDITVEGNRPDAWSMVGIARDLAARLRLPFAPPEPPDPPASGTPVETVATAVVDSLDLCPRLTVSVVRDVRVGPSPQWIARRLLLAGMRPINNVVDASNYVMLEMGQPTHPYDLSLLPGRGLSVRRARPGEKVVTLDEVERTVGVRGRSLGDTGEDCLICDAEGSPVGIGGIMGGASSEIAASTTEVLLEAAYFAPMAIARTSRRLGLRTEASARFERGCDPWGIEPSVRRFCQLLAESVPGLRVADGMLDVRGIVPEPFVVSVPIDRVRTQIGVPLGPDQIANLVEPIGFKVLEEVGAGLSGAGESGLAGEFVTVLVPTNRPDVRPEPFGIDDVIEEVARVFGYSNIPRHVPTWPQPGGITALQRSRRFAKDVLCGLGASEGWTDTFVSEAAHRDVGLTGEAVRVSNPLDAEKPFLRRTLMPGLLEALAYNAGRRQADVRLFEVGVVFSHPGEGAPRVVERAGAGGTEMAELPGERELLSAVFAHEGDDARQAVAAWDVVADAFRLDRVRLLPPGVDGLPALPGLHPTRSAHLVAQGRRGEIEGLDATDRVVIGAVGEIDPGVAAAFGLTRPTGSGAGTAPRRIGWLEVDLGLLFDENRVPRRITVGGAVSRYPSSDIDLAFVVDDAYPADAVSEVLRVSADDLLESVRLFDVYRGQGIAEGTRSLAFRLRFVSPSRTLTDEEVGELRDRCIGAVEQSFGAVLR
ncbi:MAG TPA: phenylalanine--tRNA ligase subunit beta [Acidimicrobiales bacterium]|nr:phenylalanine--tRNA ligase subunit beta [Acidimicrobiales bacterium]